MSDSSDSSTASDTSINDISDEEFYGYDHNDQEEWSDFADAADDDSMHEDDPQMENISRLDSCCVLNTKKVKCCTLVLLALQPSR